VRTSFKKTMSRILTLLITLFTCSYNYGQDFKKHQSESKHTDKIISIATSDSLFATSSYDKSVIVWDYHGKIIYRFKVADGKINSLSSIPNSNALLIGITEMSGGKIRRHIIKCLNALGRVEYELIDKRLTQEYVNVSFESNVTGVRNAIASVKEAFPELDVKNDLEVPQVSRGISHIELVQSITVSPGNRTIASIDKFNILKTWDQNHNVLQSFRIVNNKKNTNIYFRSDSTIFIEPSIILNIKDTSTQIIQGFERYSGIPFNSAIYFYFNYNNDSRPEKLFNLETAKSKTFDSRSHYTITGACSYDRLALLGVDGLIRVINTEGDVISIFGKDRNEVMTFRGEKIQLFSKICSIGFSPSGKYVISGTENGKVNMWKFE
jgi:WD40 repeat protein